MQYGRYSFLIHFLCIYTTLHAHDSNNPHQHNEYTIKQSLQYAPDGPSFLHEIFHNKKMITPYKKYKFQDQNAEKKLATEQTINSTNKQPVKQAAPLTPKHIMNQPTLIQVTVSIMLSLLLFLYKFRIRGKVSH